jgi:ceramide glucosyltransferase
MMLISIGGALAAVAAGYAVVALVAVLAFRRHATPPAAAIPVSVVKPLCGAEPGLYDNLRSFCMLDYPAYQVVFGVREADDAAIAVVRRLQGEFPSLDLDLVVDGRVHGRNYKVSNLINIFARCRHDVLVLADSDISVTRDYLTRVTAPLADRDVGVVTCLYRGRPRGGLWSRVGALFIDDWFLPSVLVAHLFGSRDFALGATIALRRDTLAAIGGFQAIASQLADDWWLGELTRRQGLRTVLSDCVVETDVVEADADALVAHELRWLRTIRSIQPLGYRFLFVTFGVPVALIGAALAHGATLALSALAVTAAARLMLHFRLRKQGRRPLFSELALLPLRDILSLGLWCASFASRRVRWREQQYAVEQQGQFREIG